LHLGHAHSTDIIFDHTSRISYTDEVDEACPGEPDTDERGDELTEADTVGRLEYVEVLQNVRDGHQPQGSSEPQTCTTQHHHAASAPVTDSPSVLSTGLTRDRSVDTSLILKTV